MMATMSLGMFDGPPKKSKFPIGGHVLSGTFHLHIGYLLSVLFLVLNVSAVIEKNLG